MFRNLLVHSQLPPSFRVFGQGLNPDHPELRIELLWLVLAHPVPLVSLGTRLASQGCWLSHLAESHHSLVHSCQQLTGLE